MRFRQLTLRDSILAGDFALEDVAVGNTSRATMFVGTVTGARVDESRAELGAAKRLIQNRPDGKRVAVPVGAVLWAEIGPEEGTK